MADGTKLKSVIIFKRKTLPKSMKFPAGVIVRAHVKGWMDETGTVDWLENIWNRRPGALLKKPSMLVWDMFRAHLTDEVKKKSKKIGTTLAVIPGGLTSVLQPLDVCLNKPFKDRVRTKWSQWMCSGEAKLTKGGNLMRPEINIVATWVKEAWDDIPSEMIIKSFKKCCISNSMDGSEDNALFEEAITSKESADETGAFLQNGDEDDLQSDIDKDIYDDHAAITEEEFYQLFGESETESNFEGFE